MLKELVEFLSELHSEPQRVSVCVDGENYAVDPDANGLRLGRHIPPVPPVAKPQLEVATLSGLAGLVAAGIDNFDGKVAIFVESPYVVKLISLDADEFGRRHVWASAFFQQEVDFGFGQYHTPEQFILRLQSAFLPTDNVVSLQRLASTLSSESSVGVQDDGLSQTVTVKQGAVTRDAIQLPPRIDLLTYRTFREIDPVRSDYMVRLKGEPGKVPTIALLEIDGGKWRLDAMELIARWLKTCLPEMVVIF